MCWDLNSAKSLLGTVTNVVGTQTQSKLMVFQLRSQIWFQDLMKLRFLMSHRGKNSVRDKVIGKKWIYSERNTLHIQRQSMGHCRWQRQPRNMWLAFMGWVTLSANEWEDYSNYFGKGAGISRGWVITHFLVFSK